MKNFSKPRLSSGMNLELSQVGSSKNFENMVDLFSCFEKFRPKNAIFRRALPHQNKQRLAQKGQKNFEVSEPKCYLKKKTKSDPLGPQEGQILEGGKGILLPPPQKKICFRFYNQKKVDFFALRGN